ncbi:MAG: hypothetical protein COY38_03000 [Candidatus Aenigmarchaeota archaeon CG_4_10_14_0_8_um_filter_37_24]|nr:hypothetical protein [Candidatus Aenigmarchaeota archaeon]OIN88603.1 MAG: hypothetical protein AUJ50_00430 [Candidatus Aenigmarchaeota archaeon CG1_02_38_14]PIV67988.1 MAG: hypothetical protein COS07_05635 [Candidatus Aenigmarchaeota archaeon CG01_land_8_20_14_3_00_37_9]PIW41656.1 MAG: hypothetical protein COW21_00790 [Candidatus Aenigmarchaeota archaeon CG15_BIG_FIL_POST_REV_8_21_14_020_37_27]PIX50727.1 MAG: hypothetical protein COZ52_02635 [Candidatus Aenigmarchaeota archaeon CG_4_8_14_3_u
MRPNKNKKKKFLAKNHLKTLLPIKGIRATTKRSPMMIRQLPYWVVAKAIIFIDIGIRLGNMI